MGVDGVRAKAKKKMTQGHGMVLSELNHLLNEHLEIGFKVYKV